MIQYSTILFISITSFMAGGFAFFFIGYVKFALEKRREAKEMSNIFTTLAQKIQEHNTSARSGAQA